MTINDEVITVKAGEKNKLFKRSFSSVPMRYTFSAKAVGSEALSGSLEIHRKRTIFSTVVESIELKPNNVVHASIWDTFVTIYVQANNDLKITLPKRDFKALKWLLVLTAWLIVVAVAVMAVSLQL